jgi:FMN phosphatase YigB (HAD superfamily)
MGSPRTLTLSELSEVLREVAAPDVWLVDVDDTLTDTIAMHHAASAKVQETLIELGLKPEEAHNVAARFDEIFRFLVGFHQAANEGDASDSDKRNYEELTSRSLGYQQNIESRWGLTKKFSREVLLKIAAEDRSILLESNELDKAVDAYWFHMANNPIFFEDALPFVAYLSTNGRLIYLITSSDARFQLGSNGQFQYNPNFSYSDKLQRLEKLRTHGLIYRSAFVGDPLDKPDPAYFKAALRAISNDIATTIDGSNVTVVGDSYKSDIETPVKENFTRLAAHVRRTEEGACAISGRILTVGNLDSLTQALAARPGHSKMASSPK